MRRLIPLLTGCLLPLAIGSAALGKATLEEIAMLGKEATPMGGEKAGNKDGSIPEWDGGLTKSPEEWKSGTKYADPFKGEKPLFTITAANMDQYADKLSEGEKAMLKAYSTFKMHVYPSHRTAAYPQYMYEGTRKVAATAQLAASGNGVTGAACGLPFPFPKNGLEVVWNVNLKPNLSFSDRYQNTVAVTRGGDYVLTKMMDWGLVSYWAPGMTEDKVKNIVWKYKQNILSPARVAGRVLLLHETIDQSKEARMAWLYNPGQRRVRRAPEYAFDNPWEGSDGLMTIDQNLGFNGSPERYDWKLIGKKEVYVPYNNYRLIDGTLKYEDILKPLHPNPDAMRYELHRVWVVEATLKEGARHLYKKRTLYVDEDSWSPVLAEMYDNRDQLWRAEEIATANFYDIPFTSYVTEWHYDLQAGRYAGVWLNAEEPAWRMTVKGGKDDEFTVDALRGEGTR